MAQLNKKSKEWKKKRKINEWTVGKLPLPHIYYVKSMNDIEIFDKKFD
jgi:hypothetical protein